MNSALSNNRDTGHCGSADGIKMDCMSLSSYDTAIYCMHNPSKVVIRQLGEECSTFRRTVQLKLEAVDMCAHSLQVK